MLVAISGGVRCKSSSPYTNFGCHSTAGKVIQVYVTEGKGYNHTIVPQNMTGSYNLPGRDSDSTFLEFELPTTGGNSDYCFKNGTEYNLWYLGDMEDDSEFDNGGTAYTDIYICRSSAEGEQCTQNADCQVNLLCDGNQKTCRKDATGLASPGQYCASNLCQEWEGDCDDDSECAGSLKCGNDNCPAQFNWPATHDCCAP